MIRVDQAGEYGALRIYDGQLAVMGDRHPLAREIARMRAGEVRHFKGFNRLIAARGVRPTALQPLWDVGGFALGAATALMGPKLAMACTAAVETEIDRHYGDQLDRLGDSDPELAHHIADYREDEREHLESAVAHGAEQAPAYPLFSAAVRLLCRAAIRAGERL